MGFGDDDPVLGGLARLAAAGWEALREGEGALEILLRRWAVSTAA